MMLKTRIVLWSTLLVVNLLIAMEILWLDSRLSSGEAPIRPPGWNAPEPDYFVFVFILAVYAADVAVLWALSKIGSPLKADVKATIKKAGGSLFLASTGLLGAFLAIAITAFVAAYLLSKRH